MVELEVPDFDEVHEDAPAYKRAVAVLVVLITLFGSAVAYLQAVDSNKEDVAARDAQRDAVAGLGAQVDASAALAADLRIGSELDVHLQREALNAGRVNNFGGDIDSDVHRAAADRFAEVREAIADLTPIDPADPATFADDVARGNESPDAARLRQSVEADRANDHGGRADSYVAVLTVLAVALFLLGLSLTVQGRSRVVLAAPGVAIAVVCVAWAVFIARRDVTEVSERAVLAAAEGLRLQDAGDLEGAIDAFDEAIDDSPDFAAALARRAGARFTQGSSQIGQTGFISITSDEALADALDDLDHALELGAGSDVISVADAAFFHFLDGDFARSAELSTQALELNDQLAQIWFNLGVAHVAQGNERQALRSYREGRQLLDDAPDAGTRESVLAGARTDLSVLREILGRDELDDVLDLIEDTEADLAAFEASFDEVPCSEEPCPTAEDVDGGAEIGDAEFSRDGPFVVASFPVEGADPGTPITNVWYLRTDDDLPFEQAAVGVETVRVADDGTVVTSAIASLDPVCPVAGEYLVRAYAGAQLLGEAEGTIDPSIVGATFTSLADPIEGFEACVPEGFEVQRSDVSDADSFTGFLGPDFDLSLNVTPGALPDGVDPQDLTREVLASILEIDDSDLEPVTLRGRDVNGNFVAIDGFVGVSADGTAAVASAFGPDNASRNVTITRTGDLDLLLEAMSLIEFTGLPAQ